MPSALSDPRLRDLAKGSPEWFTAQRILIQTKPLIRKSYDLWCKLLLADADSVPAPASNLPILELGSGSGYLTSLRPEIVASDVTPGVADRVIDGRVLPFPDNSVRAILLAHVFHHIPDVEQFLREASRVLAPGGVISMVDESHTPFARFFFRNVHPEPYDDRAAHWSFPEGDAMRDSNQALTWIVFERDRQHFGREFPLLIPEQRRLLPWFGYLMSGGVNLRAFFPAFATPAVAAADRFLRGLNSVFAIHWHLTIRKAETTPHAAALANEARYLHRSFFRTDAPPEVVNRYIAANEKCCPEACPVTDAIVARRLDAEAIELALRVRKGPGILTKKIRILFYLLEARSEYYTFFFGADQTKPWLRSLAALLCLLPLTAAKYLKGAYLIRKHGFV